MFQELITLVFTNLTSWGLSVLLFTLGFVEFVLGLYDRHEWDENEKAVDLFSYSLPKVILPPIYAFFCLRALPFILPDLMGVFAWVPFWFAFAIIAIADDLTQYWYHRLHHEVPWLWRFHRTHHSAPYMGMAMANRQNILYTVFFSSSYLTATLVYLGLGYPALFLKGIMSLIALTGHSSIKWDKPLYKYKFLHPLAWIVERTIITPSTHHAHHAHSDDEFAHCKGNFGNMLFIWDIIFGTGKITRKYPSNYGVKDYRKEEWYAQVLWPIVKSAKHGSELANKETEFLKKAEQNKSISSELKTSQLKNNRTSAVDHKNVNEEHLEPEFPLQK